MAVSTQHQCAKEHGYEPDKFLDLDGIELDELLGWGNHKPLLRRGNKIGICRYEFFAPVGQGQPSRMLKKITDRLLELGVVVEELESGLSCKDEQGVYRIYSEALIRQSGGRRRENRGRPKVHDYSQADCQLIQAAWHGAEVKNPQGRAASVRALLDDNGKPRFPKFKPSTWYDLRGKGLVK